MKIDHCFILAAGFGTRMGEVGKKLPKVLWPVFEKSLLELQIAYAKKHFSDSIYINLHHQKDKIQNHLSQVAPDVKVLVEDNILGVGGAIHNLARQDEINYSGNILILNADQFFPLSDNAISDALAKLESSPAVLFGCQVHKSLKHNQILTDDNGNLCEIVDKEKATQEVFETYSGVSLINLSMLPKRDGESSYFESVADYKNQSIPVISLKDQKYWDFGTLPRYIESMFEILELPESDTFYEFLAEAEGFQKPRAQRNSYNSVQENTIEMELIKIQKSGEITYLGND